MRKINKLLSLLMVAAIMVTCFVPFVSAEETTTNPLKFEAEDFCTGFSGNYKKATKTGTSKDTYVTATSAKVSTVTVPDCTIPVNITEAGYYDITYVVGRINKKSKVTFTLDGETIGTNADRYEEQLEISSTWINFAPFCRFVKRSVYLDASEHTLNVSFGTYKNGSAYEYLFHFDYVEFTPTATVDVSQNEPTRIEAEYYAPLAAAINTAEDNNYIVSMGDGGDASFEVPLNVAESGYYKVSYAIGYAKDTNYSVITLGVTNNATGEKTTIGTNTTTDWVTQPLYTPTDSYKSYMPITLYEKKVWLDEGDSVFSLDIAPAVADSVIKYRLDYIEFDTATPKISASEATRVEAEDWVTSSIKSGVDYASGKAYVFNGSTKTDPSFDFVVNVQEAGYYDIRYVMGAHETKYVSSISVKLDGTTIGTNDDSWDQQFKGVYSYSAGWDSYMPMSQYTSEKIWLDAKTYTISVDVALSSNSDYQYQLDYFEFIPAEAPVLGDTLTVTGASIRVSASYEDTVTGVPVLAFYNGNELVYAKVFSEDTVENATLVTLTDEANKTLEGQYTRAKLFIWVDMTNIEPVCAPVEFN